ncbi:MAG: hypothetical protein QXR85_01835 [Candidatus Micrarchaeaceae archaeon]
MSLKAYFKNPHIDFLIGLLITLFILDALFGGPHILHLGVEFVGGTEIPVSLEHSVNPSVMSTLLSTLQQRLSTFGLKEITVEGIGNAEVYVIIPTVSQSEIQKTISLIESEGVFQGIVNGKEAINGTDIISGSIVPSQSQVNGTVSWQVSFLITMQAADKFAKVVFGQANKPLYLFLDRPTNAVLLLNSSVLALEQSKGINESELLSALYQATAFDNGQIPIEQYSSSNIAQVASFLNTSRAKYSEIIIAKNAPPQIISDAAALNYTINYETTQNMTPVVTIGASASGAPISTVDSWPAIGLLSAPLLNPSVTNGSISQSYEISGSAPQGLSTSAQLAYATNQSDLIVSILKGGALPVPVLAGTPTTIPPTLGKQFEIISGIALLIAILAVSSAIAFRYKRSFLILPIVFTTLAELFIIMSIIGLIGTIDLAAVAGMIAVIGTGVDAQIIITDEFMGKQENYTDKTRLGHAFYIIWADAALLVIAMLPLFFSTSLVQIVGFAESAMLGVLFGAFVTRPAYGAMISMHFSQLEKSNI